MVSVCKTSSRHLLGLIESFQILLMIPPLLKERVTNCFKKDFHDFYSGGRDKLLEDSELEVLFDED